MKYQPGGSKNKKLQSTPCIIEAIMSRCQANSKRSRKQCRNWAIRRKTKCRFHGGRSTGPRTLKGKIRAKCGNLKHGFRTKKNINQLSSMRMKIKQQCNWIRILDSNLS